MDVWTVVRQYTFYLGHKPSDIRASAQIFIQGNHGYVYSLQGKDVIRYLERLLKSARDFGLDIIEGPMVPAAATMVLKRCEQLKVPCEVVSYVAAPGDIQAERPWVMIKIPQ